MRTPLYDRFVAKVDIRPWSECWLWRAAISSAGYGVIGVGPREQGLMYAHRYAYEQISGPIPAGLHIDHLCRVRACVNPTHLEAVTQAENNRRAARARKAAL